MKVCHWSSFNQSGMHKVAETLMLAERKLGLDSYLINIQEVPSEQWDQYADADLHVPHTHFPNEMRKRLSRPLKMCFRGQKVQTASAVFIQYIQSCRESP